MAHMELINLSVNNILLLNIILGTSMYSRTNQSFYPRGSNQQVEQLPLRSRGFSHIDNISHQSSQQQSINTTYTEDKISEIKKKYDKIGAQGGKKNYGENSNISFQATNHNKSIPIQDCYDQNSKQSNQRQFYQYQQYQKSQGKNTPSKSYIQRQSYGKGQVKSELESNRMALNLMKNQLQSKLNDLNAKTQGNMSSYPKPEPKIKKEEEESYDLILSKYSKNIDTCSTKAGLRGQSYQRPDYGDKKGQKVEINRSFILDHPNQLRYQKSHQLSTITQTNSNLSDAQKETQPGLRQKQFGNYQAYRDRTGQTTIKNDKSKFNEIRYHQQRTSQSYIDDKKTNTRQQRNSNLEFTLQKQERNEDPLSKYQRQIPSYKASLSSNKIPSKNEYKLQKNYERPSFHQDSNSFKPSNPHHQNISNMPKGQGRNSETISREIQKLDMKIRQIQQNKKALNINFSPYSGSKSINKSTITHQNIKIEISRFEKEEPSQTRSTTFIPSGTPSDIDRSQCSVIRHQEISRSPIYSRKLFPQTQNERSLGIPFTPAQSHNDDDQLTSERSTADPNFRGGISKYTHIDSETINNYRTDQKKKENHSRTQINNTIKSLVKVLGEQVSLDEVFRNNKIWFASQNPDKKWILLKKELQNVGANINESQLKQVFNLYQSQNNPFFSVSDTKCNIESLVKSYMQSQTHWNQKISHKYAKAELERQGFSNFKLDYDRKGFIEVQDLVRFLNIESGSFFRNRDLSIIFRRISKGSQMQFSELLETISF